VIDTNCDGMVMVVEDDIDVRDAISEVLEDNDYRPLRASNGREAIERLAKCAGRPCVILLDLMMPIMDGFEFRALQRADPALDRIPVVVLTAHATGKQVATDLHAEAFLKKPVDLRELLEVVARCCRRD
jgi:CheY-like chemotaxis protein